MARIRTVKPDFFQDEELQELQAKDPLLYPMFVFEGLWGYCDKQGVFEWRPRVLALGILPFLWGRNGEAQGKQLGDSLELLWEAKQVLRYVHEGKEYGFIPTFTKHQRIGGKEAQESPKYPNPVDMEEVKHRGSIGEASGKQSRRQEGKGKEEESEPKTSSSQPTSNGLRVASLLADLIVANNPNSVQLRDGKRDQTVVRWAEDIDKLNRIDGATWGQIEWIVRWCQRDGFWAANILSGKTLRAKWDQLVAKVRTERQLAKSSGRPGITELVQDQLRRIEEEERGQEAGDGDGWERTRTLPDGAC